MQARLSFIRFPSFAVTLVFALVAALILGGVVGYMLKPPATIAGRTQVIVVHDTAVGPGADACVWVAKDHKGC
jgi:hypothetical protein